MQSEKNFMKSFILTLIMLLMASSVLAAEVRLAWDQSSGEVTGYRIYYGTTQGNHPTQIEVGNVTSYTVTGLEDGVTYYFVTRAWNQYGESGDSNELMWTAPLNDTTAPAVQITGPTSSSTYATTSNTINLAGTASDDIQLSSVTWSSAQGGAGTADGTTNWTISGLALEQGENLITVTAHDSAGNTSSDTITVTFTYPQGTFTETFGDTPDADHTGTVQDTFIDVNSDVNVNSQLLNTYTWPVNKPANAILMKWDLSSIPVGAQVQSATLYLYMNSMEDGGGDADYDVSAHKIINHDPDIVGATGYTYDGSNGWTPNSNCYDNIPLAQADIAPAEDSKSIDKTYEYKTWNVTGMVRAWVTDPSSNYGLLLNSDNSASESSNRFFASSEATDASIRPKLIITYTVGGDAIPPGDVASVQMSIDAHGQTVFDWTNPSDADYAGVKIVYTDDGTSLPALNADGSIQTGTLFANVANPGTTASNTLPSGKPYNFAFFTYDTSNNYSHTFRMTIPVVTVSHAPDPVNNPKTQVTFNVTINPECLGDVTYSWNFGDGNTATATTGTITHTFDTQKQYTVTLTLTNGTCTIIREYPLTVNDLPPTKPTGTH